MMKLTPAPRQSRPPIRRLLLAGALLAAAGFLTIGPDAHAQIGVGINKVISLATQSGVYANLRPREIILRLLQVVLSLVGVIAMLVIVYGGFLYLTAAGDDTKAQQGKKTVLYAAIGLLIIGLSAALVNAVFRLGAAAGP